MNIGSSKPIRIIDLVRLLSSKYINIPKRPGEPSITYAKILRKENFGMVSKIKFRDGIKELVLNINYWKDAPLWNKSNIKKETKNWFKYLKIKNNMKNKQINLSTITKIRNKFKNKKIVLCHGVFDLLHTGHLNYFEFG